MKNKIDTNERPRFYQTCCYLEEQLKKIDAFPLHFQAVCESVGFYYMQENGFYLNTHLYSADADFFVAVLLRDIGIPDAFASMKNTGRPFVGKDAIMRFAETHQAKIWEYWQQRRNMKESEFRNEVADRGKTREPNRLPAHSPQCSDENNFLKKNLRAQDEKQTEPLSLSDIRRKFREHIPLWNQEFSERMHSVRTSAVSLFQEGCSNRQPGFAPTPSCALPAGKSCFGIFSIPKTFDFFQSMFHSLKLLVKSITHRNTKEELLEAYQREIKGGEE